MEIKKLDPLEYSEIFSSPSHVFNQLNFNLMNARSRGINIECLGFRTKKYKLGIIGSLSDNRFRSPFSAPFGGFSYIKSPIDLETIDTAVDRLVDYCAKKGIEEIEIVLPPLFYDISFISKLNNVLYRRRFSLIRYDLNYSIHLEEIESSYLDMLQYNAKKNLNISLSKDFKFHACVTLQEKELAYAIIKENRAAKGYPLRMAFETILDTINIIKADFFLVRLENEFVASAMIFHVAKNIVQVIYWGDLPAFSNNKTMNFLSYSVVNHYQKSSIKVIDIGPSTENSIPNYGLCDFKESIGCLVYPKQTWSFKF